MKYPVAWIYVAASLAIIGAMIYDEGSRHRAFFPTVTALSSNNLFHVALANGFFAALYATCWLVMRTLVGKLDQSERLSATEKFFGCFLDAVLGLAIFRTSLNYWTVVQVTCTLAWRLLHHIATVRQESMEQAASMTFLRTLRFTAMLTVLFVGDVAVSIYFFDTSRRDGIGLPTLLCVDFMVMGVIAISITFKFLFQLYEQFRGGIWEPRGTYRFYCDIATEALSCLFYIGFFIVVTRYTTTPFHIVRHLIDNVRRLTRAVRDCSTYRSLVMKLARLEDPTPEQLATDGTCSVCLGDIETPNGAKRLPCGHSFHSQCLTRWLERNNNCPYCRQELESMLARVAVPPAAPVAAPQAPPAAAAAANPAAPDGALDPFAALQDDEAIKRMYAQYLRMHREAAGIQHEIRNAAAAPAGAAVVQDRRRIDEDVNPAKAEDPDRAAAAALQHRGGESSTSSGSGSSTCPAAAAAVSPVTSGGAPAPEAAADVSLSPAALRAKRAEALKEVAKEHQKKVIAEGARKEEETGQPMAASAGATFAIGAPSPTITQATPPAASSSSSSCSATPIPAAPPVPAEADTPRMADSEPPPTQASLERRLAAFEAYRKQIQTAERALEKALARA